MEIEHIAMYVDDLEGAKAFFVKYFRAEPNELYHNPNTDFRSCFLTFERRAAGNHEQARACRRYRSLPEGLCSHSFPAGQCGACGCADGTHAGGRL